MIEKTADIWNHYQKLQEYLGELMSPDFESSSKSLLYITLNQIFTHAEKLFECVEVSDELSRHKQILLAKLAHHIENCKQKGFRKDFQTFINHELLPTLTFIRKENDRIFGLAS